MGSIVQSTINRNLADALRADKPAVNLPGLEDVRSSKRMGEYLALFNANAVKSLYAIAHSLCQQIAPDVIQHFVEQKGYLSVFLDGTEIEVTGRHFEQAYVGYSGNKQYWLHNIFIGHLWVSGRLNPGASDVCIGWKEQLENDVSPLIEQGIPVWHEWITPTTEKRLSNGLSRSSGTFLSV